MPAVALSIAGSDPSGGAGIQADLKTFLACGVFGAAVVTSLTAQDTTGVHARRDVEPEFVAAQLDAVLADLPVAAAKTGMLPSAATVEVVASRWRGRAIPLVVDPVLAATSGDALADASALLAIRRALLPLAAVVTPNLAEATALVGRRVETVADMRDAARALVDLGAAAALVTGGHLADRACDVLVADGIVHELDAPRVPVGPTHGTGCTLSAAIAAGLAQRLQLPDAVARAKRYVTKAIAAAKPLGRGARPLDHRVDPENR